MPRILYTPLAETDLEDIWMYTAERWSVDQAEAYTSDLIAVVEDLARGVREGRPVLVRDGAKKHLSGRHVIFFRETASDLIVLRILHQSMDVERRL